MTGNDAPMVGRAVGWSDGRAAEAGGADFGARGRNHY